jgi:hypothetical protein
VPEDLSSRDGEPALVYIFAFQQMVKRNNQYLSNSCSVFLDVIEKMRSLRVVMATTVPPIGGIRSPASEREHLPMTTNGKGR